METNKIKNIKMAKQLTSKMNSFNVNIMCNRQAYDRLMAITKALTAAAFKGGDEFDKAVKDAENFIQEFSA